MNKKLLFISVLGLSISCLGVIATSTALKYSKAEEPKTYYVDFFSNYLRQEFTLSNGFKGLWRNPPRQIGSFCLMVISVYHISCSDTTMILMKVI